MATGTMAVVNPQTDPGDATPRNSFNVNTATCVGSTDCRPCAGTSGAVLSDDDQAVTFASLMPIPHRERPRGKSVRKRPSYDLASIEHYQFAKQKTSVEKKAKPKGKSMKPADSPRPKGKMLPKSVGLSVKAKGKKPPKRASSKGKAYDTTPRASCNKLFCDDKCGEKWIQCQVCCKWFQCACQGIDNDVEDPFICISCDDSD